MLDAAGLLEGLEEAVSRRPAGRRAVELADPCAAVFASRMAGDRWFCWEQPDHDGFALAALGSAHEAVSRGPERFIDLVRE